MNAAFDNIGSLQTQAPGTSRCPLPSLAPDDRDFRQDGAYWRGSVWLPTAYMAVKATDGCGDYALARHLSRELLRHMVATYRDFEPHTIWECYSPTEAKPGTYAKRPGYSRPDFCGWSALGPISLFIEHVIGIRSADAFTHRLSCDFPAKPVGRVGARNYRFGKVVCDIVATADEITVDSNAPFTLVADGREFAVSAGKNRWSRHCSSTLGRGGSGAVGECLEDHLGVSAAQCRNHPFGGWIEVPPRPLFDERPDWVAFYDKAWELAHAHIVEVPGLPAPCYMDCGHRSDRIWIWDTCFMALFCKYCPEEFPGVESLDNFYSLILDGGGGPLPKVRGNRWCGADEGRMLDFMVQHVDNPPLFAWVELEHALQTGDIARLEKVYRDRRWLQRWFRLFESFDPDSPKPFGVCVPVALRRAPDGYHWAGTPSGMDNTPRGRTAACPAGDPARCPDNPDLLWIDALAQQGLAALCLSRIAALLGHDGEAEEWRARWAEIRDKANTLYWDDTDGFYYDILESDRSKVKVRTIASFWPLLARMPTPPMAERLLSKLRDPAQFGCVPAAGPSNQGVHSKETDA